MAVGSASPWPALSRCRLSFSPSSWMVDRKQPLKLPKERRSPPSAGAPGTASSSTTGSGLFSVARRLVLARARRHQALEHVAVHARELPQLDVERGGRGLAARGRASAGQTVDEAREVGDGRLVNLLLEAQEQARERHAGARHVERLHLVALVGRELQVHPGVVGELRGHHGEDGDGDHRDDERHAALAPGPSGMASLHRRDLAVLGARHGQYLGSSVLSITRVWVV